MLLRIIVRAFILLYMMTTSKEDLSRKLAALLVEFGTAHVFEVLAEGAEMMTGLAANRTQERWLEEAATAIGNARKSIVRFEEANESNTLADGIEVALDVEAEMAQHDNATA